MLGFGALAAGQGRLTLGTLVAFITLMLSLVWPVASLGFLLAMTQEAMTAADRIAEVLDTEPERRRTATLELVRPRGDAAVRGRRVPLPRRASTTCCATSTSTSPRARPSRVVGATGSGKTVLTALVPRLYDVTAGRDHHRRRTTSAT